MPGNVEERVVEMRFNNANFEKNANTSLKTLDRLDSQLNLLSGGKGLEKLGSVLDQISHRFSAIGVIGDQVLRRISDGLLSVVNSGIRLVKSLSIDQMTSGWDKYAQKTAAVQTVMAATAKEFEETGGQMEYVEGQLDKLSWFTDETSYSFLDMVSNMGKFTSNGVKLDDAVTAMQGISVWAAASGGGIQQASMAMYNLSQAMGVGAVKAQDWRSIETANMATMEFRQTALNAAVALNMLTKTQDGLYKTMKGHTFTIEQFSQQLSDGWFSKEVLTATLNEYGKFSDKLHEVTEETGMTATQVLQAVRQYKETKKVLPSLAPYMKELASEEYDIGYRAFQAAQEAKTFKEAIDSVKEAVSSGWMQTFELIFGNYEEAKVLWTDLANGLYEVFAEAGNERNEIFKEWKALGGRDILLEGLYSAGSSLLMLLERLKESFRNIFPQKTAEDLLDLTQRLTDFLHSLEPTTDSLDKFGIVLEAVFSILDTGRLALWESLVSIFERLKKAATGIFPPKASKNVEEFVDRSEKMAELFPDLPVKHLSEDVKEFSRNVNGAKGTIEEFLDALRPSEETLGKIERIFQGLFAVLDIGKMALDAIWGSLQRLFPTLGNVGSSLLDAAASLGDWLVGVREIIKENDTFTTMLSSVSGFFSTIWGFITAAGEGISNFIRSLFGLDESISIWGFIGEKLQAAGSAVSDFFNSLREGLQGVTSEENAGNNIIKVLGGLLVVLQGLYEIQYKRYPWVWETLKNLLTEGAFSNLVAGATEAFRALSTALDSFANDINSRSLLKIAASLAILALSLIVLSAVKMGDIVKSLGTLALSLGMLTGALLIMNHYIEGSSSLFSGSKTKGIIQLAAGVLLLSLAIAIFSKIKIDDLEKGLLAMILVITTLVVAISVLSKYAENSKGMLAAGAAMIGMAFAILIMTGAIAAFSFIPIEKLAKGVGAMIIILAAMTGALVIIGRFSENSGRMLAAAASMLAMAMAMMIFAAAVAVFSLLKNIERGLQGFVVVLGAVTLALGLISEYAKPGPILAAAAAMLILSVAMVLFAGAMALLASMKNLEPALVAFIVILGVASIALGILGGLGGMILVAAASLLILSVSVVVAAAGLLVLSIALNALTGIPIAAIADGLVLLGFALLPLAIGCLAMSLGIIGAGSLLVLGFALNMYDGLNLAAIAGGLTLLGLAFVVLGVGGLVLGVGAAGLLLGSVAMIALALVLPTFAEGLHSLDDLEWDSIVKGLVVLAEACLALAGLGAICSAFAGGLAVLTGVILGAGAGLYMAGEGIAMMVDSLLKIPDDAASKVGQLGKAMGRAILADKSSATDAMEEVMLSLANVITEHLLDFDEAFTNLLTNFADIIQSKKLSVMNAFGTLMTASLARINISKSSFISAGGNLSLGIAQGIEEQRGWPMNAIERLAEDLKRKFEEKTKIESPSKVFAAVARYIPMGIARGIIDNASYATTAVEDVGDMMITAMTPAMAILSELMNGDVEFDPTIRPVLDMSDVNSQAGAISSLFGAESVGVKLGAIVSGSVNDYRDYTHNQATNYSGEIGRLIALNQQLVDLAKAGGQVYIDGDVIAGTVNSRLGVL